MERRKSTLDLIASLAVIQSNNGQYYSGTKYSYLPVAVELRKLLCDTQRGTNNSIIPRIIQDFRLNPISGSQSHFDKFPTIYIPGIIKFDGKGGSKLELFNEVSNRIPLDEWLEQNIFDSTTTLKSFIRSIADKEAAHSDIYYNSILSKTKIVTLSDDTVAAKTIIAIGCYVVKWLAIDMINENKVEINQYVLNEFRKVGRGWVIIDLNNFASHLADGISPEY